MMKIEALASEAVKIRNKKALIALMLAPQARPAPAACTPPARPAAAAVCAPPARPAAACTPPAARGPALAALVPAGQAW